jgi:hypothetical protein
MRTAQNGSIDLKLPSLLSFTTTMSSPIFLGSVPGAVARDEDYVQERPTFPASGSARRVARMVIAILSCAEALPSTSLAAASITQPTADDGSPHYLNLESSIDQLSMRPLLADYADAHLAGLVSLHRRCTRIDSSCWRIEPVGATRCPRSSMRMKC